MRFPLTLGARGSCTIGGLASTNAGGTQVLKFGTMRSLVAGVEAVLPDGSIHDGLSGLKKDNRGYSLDQLLIGAEGTLGVVTAVALRLVPAIASRAVAWAGVDSPMRALELLRFLEARTDRIEGFELVPADSLRARAQPHPGHSRAAGGNAHPWHVLVEATTADREARTSPPSSNGCSPTRWSEGIIGDAMLAANEAQAEAFWQIRDSISEAERAEGQTLAARHLRAGRRHAALHHRGRGRGRAALSRSRSPAASAISATATSISTSAPAATPRRTGTRARARRSPAWSTTSSPPPAARSRPSTASAS